MTVEPLTDARIDRLREHCRLALTHCYSLSEAEKRLLLGFLAATKKPGSQPRRQLFHQVRQWLLTKPGNVLE